MAWQAVVVLPQSYRLATLSVLSWDRGIAITLAPDETRMSVPQPQLAEFLTVIPTAAYDAGDSSRETIA